MPAPLAGTGFYRTGYRRRTRPTLGSRVDWGHPLARGLVGCFLLDESGGSVVSDLCMGATLPITGATWGQYGLRSTATGQGAYGTVPAALEISWPLTIAWQGTQLGVPASFGDLFGCTFNNSGGSPFATWLLQYDNSSPPKLTFFTNNNNALVTTNSAGTSAQNSPAAGTHFQFVATVSSWDEVASNQATIFLYNNGVQVQQGGISNNLAIAYGTAPAYGIGATGSGAANPNLASEVAYLWNRRLTPSEVLWLYAEPYSFIDMPHSTKYVFVKGTAGTGANPAALLPAM